jgi:uncharacterized protein (TIGR03435 family)
MENVQERRPEINGGVAGRFVRRAAVVFACIARCRIRAGGIEMASRASVAASCVVGTILLTVVLSAQVSEPPATPAFEVASIRPASFPNDAYFRGYLTGTGTCGMSRFEPKGNRVSMSAVTLCSLIRMAHEVTEYQVLGMPDWMTRPEPSLFYQVDARAPGEATITGVQARTMLQRLLAERFKLAFHREPRAAPVYALVVARTGHKLSTSDVACPIAGVTMLNSAGTLMSCKPQMSMSQLVYALSRLVDRPVVDRTGLVGQYALVLKWAAADPLAGGDGVPSVFTAIQEQLGLSLEPRSEPMDALIIDRVEPASAN